MDEDEGFLCRGDTGAVLTVSPRSLVGLLFPPPYGDLFSLFATFLHLKFSRNYLLKHSSDWWNCGSDSSFHSISYSFSFFFFFLRFVAYIALHTSLDYSWPCVLVHTGDGEDCVLREGRFNNIH